MAEPWALDGFLKVGVSVSVRVRDRVRVMVMVRVRVRASVGLTFAAGDRSKFGHHVSICTPLCGIRHHWSVYSAARRR